MDNRIQLISDGDGLAVVGSPVDVEHFLASERLLSLSKDLGLRRLGSLLRAGSGVARAASEIAAHSGRWVKLTEESAQLVKKFGLMESRTPGISHAMVGKPGAIGSWLQIVQGTGSFLTSPAVLTGAAGIMAQLARQHEMGEIRDCLATIDRKIDDVIRAQKDAELGKVSGAGLDIESAMTVLEVEGRVDDDTWSTVQARTHTITDALGWALRRFDALAERAEGTTGIGDLVRTAKQAEFEVQELLVVVARCFELQSALDALRLARALEESPEVLEGRRRALTVDRRRRRELVSGRIEHLMARLDAAADRVNSNVLLHLSAHRAVVGSVNHVGITVDEFHRPLGIESARPALETTRWWDAARDPAQLRNATAEVGRKAVVGAVVVGAAGVLAKGAHGGRDLIGNGTTRGTRG
ncbi:hypothetical protein [Streptomyces sp. ML-6]|uniref:hypothetical protein n=1 Tax=Streptomyces sp. ML-6 TaxID=2982693 RepID=UPI0024BF37A2|nr:hypothetical protein [Streptomyces sp. ML-6]MDK0524663.1 hypothetical protein [Streptomyces sp. ML-6]